MKRFDVRLTDRDFERFSRLVYEHCGIRLPPHKQSMLEAGLRKRLRANDLHSFEDYAELIIARKNSTEELVKLIDVVTTNKTDFFREPTHFDYLVNSALTSWVQISARTSRKPLCRESTLLSRRSRSLRH